MRQSTARRGFLKKTIFKTVPPYRISHFIHEGYFPPAPRRCAGALARPHVPSDGKPPLFARRRGSDDGTRATTERGNHARGTDRQKKILHRPFVFRDAETRVGTPVGRTVARFPPRTGNDRHHRHRESHAPRGSDGVTKGLSLRSRGRSRDTMHAKVEYKRIESNRSSLGRARGGLTTTTTTTTARMFPSWTDGRPGTRRARTWSFFFSFVRKKKGFDFRESRLVKLTHSEIPFSPRPVQILARACIRGGMYDADSDRLLESQPVTTCHTHSRVGRKISICQGEGTRVPISWVLTRPSYPFTEKISQRFAREASGSLASSLP